MSVMNIVELIERNPITKLSSVYNNKLLIKIKDNFTSFEQQLFVSSFYCYLNYDKNMDFIVDLDNIWTWLGFTLKENAKRMLLKYFKIDIDYKEKNTLDFGKSGVLENIVISTTKQEKVKQNGGQNKQTILLTIKCFKSFCLKAQTKKAGEIHEYYMKMEEVMHQIVGEETDELRLQLEQKENIIIQQDKETKSLKKEKLKAVEQATIAQFPLNTECIYFGTIDNTNEQGEKLIKFGHTNDLATRLMDHRKKYTNFILAAAFRVQNKVEIENLIKTYPKIKRQIRSIEIAGKTKTEIIAYDGTNFTIDRLSKHIKDIIHSKTYSIDNFNRIMRENETLEDAHRQLVEDAAKNKATITTQAIEIADLHQKLGCLQAQLDTFRSADTSVYQNVLLPEDDLNRRFAEFIDAICIVRPDVEDNSVNIEGRYRLWSQTKPSKEVFHELKNYLDTRFKPKRIQGHHGYIGIRLKQVEYKKIYQPQDNSLVETFIFERCRFSDTGKILNSALLAEYQRWKRTIRPDEPINDKDDMADLKEYLNASKYALKATVWVETTSNEGYYGLSLFMDIVNAKPSNSTTGKKVTKTTIATGNIFGTWDSIASAAQSEGMCAAKMSRSIKNNVIFGDYSYRIQN